MKITLVACHAAPSPQAVPLANAFLRSYAMADALLSDTVDIGLADFFVTDQASACAATIMARQPEAVGFSMYVWNRTFCLEVAGIIRTMTGQPVLFAGGPEVTADGERLLKSGCFDFLITGEGERSFKEAVGRMAAGASLDGIAGVRQKGDKASVPPTGSATIPLEDIPSPYLDGTLDPAATGGVLWQLSRGCGFNCDFCFDSRGSGGVRYFPLSRVEEELQLFVQKDVQQVFVLDSTFNLDRKRAKSILKMIARTAPHIHFHFEVRSEFLDLEMATLFSEITCSLQIGLQSTDPAILKGVNRKFDPADFTRRIGLLNDCGIIFGFDLIYGLPGDTLAGFRKSLDDAIRLYPNHLDIFPLAILPGTALARRATPGIRYLDQPPYTVTETPTFTKEDMAKAERLAEACDIFYTRGRAVAWFNAMLMAISETPSRLFELFNTWRKRSDKGGGEAGLQDAEIWRLQREFLGALLAERKHAKLIPLLLDLVDYHYHYGSLVVTPEIEPGPERPILDQSCRYLLHGRARLVTFSYDIDEILDAGEVDLAEFVRHHRRSGSCAVMYPGGGEVRTEPLDPPYFKILERLQRPASIPELGTGDLPPAELTELLKFTIGEGIVVQAGQVKDCRSGRSSRR